MKIEYILGIIAATILTLAGAGWLISTFIEPESTAIKTMWSSPDYSNTATYDTLRTNEFASFVNTYDRDYDEGSSEYQYRLEWFSENYEWIQAFSGDHTVDVNHFADWTDEEYQKILDEQTTSPYTYGTMDSTTKSTSVSETYETSSSIRGPVVDQGLCASGWAMSAASVTSTTLRKIGRGPSPTKYKRISDQEIMDCVSSGSCNGGSLADALNYIEDSDAVKLASDYSYKAKKRSQCNKYGWSLFSRPEWTFDYDSYDTNSKRDWTQYVNYRGAVVSYINADCREFRFYSSGIIDEDITCSNSNNANHYLMGVGYDVSGSNDYALLQNTWGTDWGDQGMVKLKFANNPTGFLHHFKYVYKYSD